MVKEYKHLLYTYFLLMFIGVFPLFLFTNMELFLKVNKKHSIYMDNFFYYISFLGNGFVYIGLFILLTLLKVKNRYLIGAGLGLILTTIIVKSMKHLIFYSYSRPSALLPNNYDLHIVKNIILKQESSFPSGHAAIIFAMVCFLAFLLKPSLKYMILIFILASLVSFSRIYLCQHFYRDVYIGALIGGTCTILCFININNYKKFDYFLDNNMIDIMRNIKDFKK